VCIHLERAPVPGSRFLQRHTANWLTRHRALSARRHAGPIRPTAPDRRNAAKRERSAADLSRGYPTTSRQAGGRAIFERRRPACILN
jgi:hypothetical protein